MLLAVLYSAGLRVSELCGHLLAKTRHITAEGLFSRHNVPGLTCPARNMSVYMPVMIGDDDPSSPLAAPASGAVPAPPVGSAAAGAYLKADGAFDIPTGAAITVNGTPTVKVNGAAVSYSSQVTVNGV